MKKKLKVTKIEILKTITVIMMAMMIITTTIIKLIMIYRKRFVVNECSTINVIEKTINVAINVTDASFRKISRPSL